MGEWLNSKSHNNNVNKVHTWFEKLNKQIQVFYWYTDSWFEIVAMYCANSHKLINWIINLMIIHWCLISVICLFMVL